MTLRKGFTLGSWKIYPLEGRLVNDEVERRVQPKSMDVLLCLAEAGGDVVEREKLLVSVWGERAPSDEPLTRCIGELRRSLGDQRDQPVYIKTIQKRGYKLLVPVEALEQAAASAVDVRVVKKRALTIYALTALVAVATGLAVLLLMNRPDLDRTPNIDANPMILTNIRGTLPAIAVLPFLNLSDQSTDSYLADGTAETLTQVLSRVGGLKVVARSSAFIFREAEDVRVIGDALQVDAVLEGSVQKHNNIVRITTQLVATDDGRHLWAAAFDRPLDDLFAVQDEIATEVAAALQLTLLHGTNVKHSGTEDFEAYREYLLGREYSQARTADSIIKSVTHFSRAMELDPQYALAYVGYADAVNLQYYYLNRSILEIEAIARPALQKALDLNPDLGEAYAALGMLLFNLKDIEGAENALQRAVVLSPNYARAYFGYGTVYNDTGRPANALTMHLNALELNPLAPHINSAVAVAYEKLGRFNAATTQFERAMEVAPKYGAVRYRAGMLKWDVEGDAMAAKQLYEQAVDLDPDNPWAPSLMARLYLDLGDDARAAEWLAVAEEGGESIITGDLRAFLLILEGAPPAQRIEIARRFFDQSRLGASSANYLRIGRDAFLEQDEPDGARALYRMAHPELFDDDGVINWTNFMPAVDLALVLVQTGEQPRAELLLRKTDAYIASLPRKGCCGYGLADVEIAAIRGEVDQALLALEQAIAEGWKVNWRWETEYNPNLASLAGNERYRVILDTLVEDMATRGAALEIYESR